MAEIITHEEPVLCHYKGGKLVGITHFNGGVKFYPVPEEAKRKDYADFYEVEPIRDMKR